MELLKAVMEDPKSNNNRMWKHINNAQIVRYLLMFAIAWAIAQVLAYFSTVLIIFIFAAILAFLLNYPVKFISRFMSRSIAVLVVFLIALLVIGGLTATLGLAVIAQAQQLIAQAPKLLESMIAQLQIIQSFMENQNIKVDFSTFEGQLREQAIDVIGKGLTTLQDVLFNVLDIILIGVISFFMLSDGKRLWRLIMKIFPAHVRHDVTKAIQMNFLGFFWGRLLLSGFFGISTFVVLIVLNTPYPLVLASVAGAFDLIPGIGATIGISLICLIILPQGIFLSLKILVGCIILQQIEENLLMPRIMKGSININPVIMFFALLVGARVAGLIGVFLSIPITGVIISILDVDEMRGEITKKNPS
ncbi:AI-2E family transporter [Pseudanabaena sp. CCNP1317]|nr:MULTISPECIES: AI-2E family transporter [Pseudanabaena]MEA5487943.1 AI-2E family transporter [Pseudanabaena sp. CCNP1317]WGS73795.1 AI-2E family transporter [Pseudanabaena galeata CCNP1313]